MTNPQSHLILHKVSVVVVQELKFLQLLKMKQWTIKNEQRNLWKQRKNDCAYQAVIFVQKL